MTRNETIHIITVSKSNRMVETIIQEVTSFGTFPRIYSSNTDKQKLESGRATYCHVTSRLSLMVPRSLMSTATT